MDSRLIGGIGLVFSVYLVEFQAASHNSTNLLFIHDHFSRRGSEPHSIVPGIAAFMSTSSLAMVVAMLHSSIGSTPETFEEFLVTMFNTQ